MKSSDRFLMLTALAVFVWVVLRAATQAITIDEATTYMLFVMHPEPFHWLGSTNNHVLNTAAMRLSTMVFGLSEFTVRIPTLLGAALYITASLRFCRRMGGEWWLQWLALVCLIGSPFVMDYLVAARGYGLALGFLMTLMLCDFRTPRGCAWASACGALCLASNFSFALAAIAAGVVIVIRSLRESKFPKSRLLVAYLLPGLAITSMISLPSILNFPREELWYGVRTLRETFASLVESQTYEINPVALQSAQLYLFPLLAIVSIVWLAWNWRRLPTLAMQFGATFLLTIVLHALAFHGFGLLYPWDRTGLFLVPLGLGAIFTAASIPGTAWLRYAQIGVLGLLAVNNALCLRLDYFEEWYWDRDTDRIYAKLACLHDREHVNHVASGWPYIGPLNFYREMAPRGRFEAVVDEGGSSREHGSVRSRVGSQSYCGEGTESNADLAREKVVSPDRCPVGASGAAARERLLERMTVLVAALFAFLIVLARAATQAITTDEAAWWGLGASPLMLRLPALVLAVIYIAVVAFFCRVAFKKPYVQVAVFVCLALNPFVLDHLVAARLPVTSPIYESLFYRLNPELANVYVLPVFAAIQPYLLPVIALSALGTRFRPAAHAANVLLIGTTMTLAMYFLLCLRLDHFKDAREMSTSNQVYATLACLSEEHNLRRVTASADFVGPLNLYRASRPAGLEEIVPIEKDPGREVYAIHFPKDNVAVGRRGLAQFYSDYSTAMVAVTPELAERLRESPCLPRPK